MRTFDRPAGAIEGDMCVDDCLGSGLLTLCAAHLLLHVWWLGRSASSVGPLLGVEALARDIFFRNLSPDLTCALRGLELIIGSTLCDNIKALQ